jgi:hypothetical protein
MADSAALLVDDILPHQPMRQWVLSVPFPLRFLFASQPAVMTRVLAIVYRAIATHLTHKAGVSTTSAKPGAVTLIQRFGSALNLNIHLTCMDTLMSRAHGCAGATHVLFLDGVYIDPKHGNHIPFRRVKAPICEELTKLTHTIAHRIGRYLERQGLLESDTGNSYLTAQAVDAPDDDPSHHLLGYSITYRIAMGPQQGRKVFAFRRVLT